MVLAQSAFAVIDAQGSYILKPSPEDFPHLAENEHATMHLMARLGLRFHRLVCCASGRSKLPTSQSLLL